MTFPRPHLPNAIATAWPQHNRKRGWPLDKPTHWEGWCYGCTGYGDDPLSAFAKACERWLMWNMVPYVDRECDEWKDMFGFGVEKKAEQSERTKNEQAGQASDGPTDGVRKGVL